MKFTYEAKTKQGEFQNGIIEASSREAAIDILQRHDLVILRLKAESETPIFSKRIKIFERVSGKDLVLFSRQLATLFGAKVPLIESFQILAGQAENLYFQEIILSIAKELEGGMSLSQTMGRHPKAFSEFYISMIKSGEVSGKLEEVFEFLAESLERQYTLSSKVFNALIYPAVVFILSIVIVLAMFVFVVPNLEKILVESGQKLPLVSRIIFSISGFVINFWYVILIFGLLGAAILSWRGRTEMGRIFIDRLKLRLPIFGTLFQKIAVSRFSDSLGTLINGGLPIVQAIEITSDVVGNREYKRILLKTADQVKKGFTMSSVLKAYPDIMPPMVSQMVFIGEETGRLEEVLKKVSKFYSEETTRALDTLVTLIEPILIVFLGGFVFVIIIALLFPFYNIALNL